MDNRLTCSTLACPTWTLQQIVESFAAAGLRGVDFRGIGETLDHTLLPAFNEDANATRAMLAERSLEVPCMCSSIRLMTPDASEWRAMLDEYERYLSVADRFASPFVRIFPGSTPENMPRDEAATMARQRASELASIAASGHRAAPILETHDDWGATAEVVKLLADVEPAEFGVLWDVRHSWAAGESPEEAIATLGNRLRHVHVKDATVVEEREEPTLLGDGIVTVGEALRALKKENYSGWICLEAEKRWRPATTPEPEVTVPQFVEFVRSI